MFSILFLKDFSAEKMRSHAACVTELRCKADDVVCICQERLPSSTERCCWPRSSLGTCLYLSFLGWTRRFTACKCGHDETVGIDSALCLWVGQFHPGTAWISFLDPFLSAEEPPHPALFLYSLPVGHYWPTGQMCQLVFSLPEHLCVSGPSSAFLKGTSSHTSG